MALRKTIGIAVPIFNHVPKEKVIVTLILIAQEIFGVAVTTA